MMNWEDDDDEPRVSYSKTIGTKAHYPDIPEDGRAREVRLSKKTHRKRNKRAFIERERAKKFERKRKS